MPFSGEFLYHKSRSGGLQGTPDHSGVLTFTKSADHATVTDYAVRVYAQGGSTVLASRNLGKPVPYSDGSIWVDITSLLTPLGSGNYTVTVVTTSPGGSAESSGDDFSLPLT